MYKFWYGDWKDWLIALLTLSKYSHCEVEVGIGRYMSASPRDEGVRVKEIKNISKKWDVYMISMPGPDFDAGVAWGASKNGAEYDWGGALTAPLGGFLNNKNKYFCFEFVIGVLRATGRYTSGMEFKYGRRETFTGRKLRKVLQHLRAYKLSSSRNKRNLHKQSV